MIDWLNLFHIGGFKFQSGRWVVSVCGSLSLRRGLVNP